jgi:uncharacterized protein (TIGR03663 family)
MNKKAFAGLFFLVFVAALMFRFIGLDRRPMHHDEANQALKFGALLERGEYRYDKEDHHGPSLYYFSLPFARALGANTLASLSETSLRLVPAIFGLGTVLLLLLLLPALGRAAVFWSALALALSPVMVYFSRFYIQEIFLVFFSVGFMVFLWRYLTRPSWGWALGAGIFAGMMYATKETSVIAFGAISVAFMLTLFLPNMGERRVASRQRARPLHLLLGLAAALFTALVLFTSFFQNPKGFLDSLLTFKVYFVRAGESSFHVHPWYYYFQILAFSKGAGRLFWSEAFILVLAVAGSVAAFRITPSGESHPSFLKFLFFYTLAATAAYSLIPYKTPWNLLPFYLGYILLAGSGAVFILRACPNKVGRVLILFLLSAGFLDLAAAGYKANFIFPADPKNPYVYAQTSPDFLKLIHRVEDLAALEPEGKKMLIKVIAGPYETWPLPWYLRGFARVGYWPSVEDAGEVDAPPLVISSAEEAGPLESSLKDMYRSEYYGLRPEVFLVLHVRNDLWEKFLESRARE